MPPFVARTNIWPVQVGVRTVDEDRADARQHERARRHRATTRLGDGAPAAIDDALVRYAASREPGLREALVVAHVGLAHWAAGRFAGRGEPFEDLVQVALIGLLKAIDRFDPARGPSFSAYAVATMLGELKRHLRDRSWAVRPPRTLHDRYLRVRSAVDGMTQELGRSPTLEEIAVRAGVAVEEVVEAGEVGAAWRQDSLDERMGPDDWPEARRADLDGDGSLEAVERRADLAPLLSRLSPRARVVVHLRFVEDMTQSQIAAHLGVSQMQISRILAQSLGRLRTWQEASRRADHGRSRPPRG